MTIDVYYDPTHRDFTEDDIDNSSSPFLFSMAAIGSLCLTLERTIKKVDAYFHITKIENDQSTNVLPTVLSDLDFSSKNEAELEKYKKIYNSINWSEIGGWTVCTALLSGMTIYLV